MSSLPIAPLVRYLITQLGAQAAAEAYALYLDRIVADVDQPEARRCVFVWSRSTGDDVQTSIDILNVTGGDPDASWTNADFQACETPLLQFWGTLRSITHTSHSLEELRWYRLRPGDLTPGPAVRVLPVTSNKAGTATGDLLPPQIGATITERTPLRRHWGRMYIPGMVETHNTATGRLTTSLADHLRTAYWELADRLNDADFYPVVFSKRLQGLLSVNHVQVDDVWDVQRRRRYEEPTYKATSNLAPIP